MATMGGQSSKKAKRLWSGSRMPAPSQLTRGSGWAPLMRTATSSATLSPSDTSRTLDAFRRHRRPRILRSDGKPAATISTAAVLLRGHDAQRVAGRTATTSCTD